MKEITEFEEFIKDYKLTLDEAIKETMILFIKEIRKEYPQSLTVTDISEITNYSENSIYLLLNQGEIPYAKKLKGWRVPRDTFLLWWYCSLKEVQINKAVS